MPSSLRAASHSDQMPIRADVKDNLTLENGTVTMEGNGALDFLGSQTLGGPGTVDFLDNPASENQKGLYVPDAGDTLTIASGVLVHGNAGFVGKASGGLVTSDGTIAADGSGTITVQGSTNFAGGILTGGTWEAAGAGTLRLLGANVSTNAASIVLDGAGAAIDSSTGTTSALAGLITNSAAGSFTLQDGRSIPVGRDIQERGNDQRRERCESRADSRRGPARVTTAVRQCFGRGM